VNELKPLKPQLLKNTVTPVCQVSKRNLKITENNGIHLIAIGIHFKRNLNWWSGRDLDGMNNGSDYRQKVEEDGLFKCWQYRLSWHSLYDLGRV
jgi:hypothetical protein